MSKIRKLILIDEEENLYEVVNPKIFEQDIKTETIKKLYQYTYNYLKTGELLDEMVTDGLLIKKCADEEADKEITDNLNYTLKYLGKILEQRLGLEYEVYKESVDEEFNKCLRSL